MKPILECRGLTKSYNKTYNALDNLNLTLDRGQIVGFWDLTEAERAHLSN